jgi:hypothetical protein
MGWAGIAVLVALIVLTFVSTDWVPLVGVVVIAAAFLGYEYLSKR